MKKKQIVAWLVTLLLSLFIGVHQISADQTIFRLYNPSNGEHLYTTDRNERDALYFHYGWGFEGEGWIAPSNGTPVYRLYHAGLQNHLYTSDINEITILTTRYGWVRDNGGKPLFYSGGSTPIYRVYNQGLRGLHHWTTDVNEYNSLPSFGWKQEGVKFNAIRKGEQIKTHYRGTTDYRHYGVSDPVFLVIEEADEWANTVINDPTSSYYKYSDYDIIETVYSGKEGTTLYYIQFK